MKTVSLLVPRVAIKSNPDRINMNIRILCVVFCSMCFQSPDLPTKAAEGAKSSWRKTVSVSFSWERKNIRMQDKLDLYSGEHFSEFVAYFEPQPSSINYWQQELGCWQHLFTRPQVIFSYHLCIAARPLSR